MVGLANRSSGYSNADVQFLQPLLSTIGQLETARRAELARSHVEAELARTSALLAEKTRALRTCLRSFQDRASTLLGWDARRGAQWIARLSTSAATPQTARQGTCPKGWSEIG